MVGRFMNLRTEIKPVATDQLLSTFLMHGQLNPFAFLAFFSTFSQFSSLFTKFQLYIRYQYNFTIPNTTFEIVAKTEVLHFT